MLRTRRSRKAVHAARRIRSRPSGGTPRTERYGGRYPGYAGGRTHRGGGLRPSKVSVLPGTRGATKHARNGCRSSASGQCSRKAGTLTEAGSRDGVDREPSRRVGMREAE
jgi:hypothetical protein